MYSIIKRCFDFVCALIALIVLSPVFLLAAIGILLSDWGPIFYKANRIGKGNKPFKMYKFRSMRVVQRANEASLRPDEDRIFPFGHFIRKAKIDELPQLINILNGTMSIIGPRPVAEDQFDMFRYGKWNEAAKVPVGLSGPAALYDYIYGDQITEEKEYMEKVYPTRRELEYTYVQKASIGYDLKMIIYTVICICYALVGKEATWILRELQTDAEESSKGKEFKKTKTKKIRKFIEKKAWILKWMLVYLGAISLFALWFLCLAPCNWGSNVEIKSFGDAFYFSVVTITSLGFGDIYPATGSFGRFLVSAEAIVGILIIGFFLNDVAQRQAIRLDEQNKVADEEKKAKCALESLKTFKQILQPVFDRYLRGIYMMVTPMNEKFNMPNDIFQHDFNFKYKDLSNIYEQTILMSADYQVPAIDAHFKNQDILFNELKYFVTNADLSYWPELKNQVNNFIAEHHQFQMRDIIINNRLRKMDNGEQLSDFVAKQIANTEEVPKFRSGNILSPYVALYHTTKANVKLIKDIFNMMGQALNESGER